MDTPFSKRSAKAALGLETDAALAEFFGVSRAAVSQWPEDAALPDLRQLQLERHLMRGAAPVGVAANG